MLEDDDDFSLSLEADLDDELDDLAVDDQQDLMSIINSVVYENLVNARTDLANNVFSPLLAEKVRDCEIVMETEFSGYVLIDDETEELLEIEEKGIPGFSIREAMLNSPSVKTSAEGIRFVRIPFKGSNRDINPMRTGSVGRQLGLYDVRGPMTAIRTLSDNSPLNSWFHPGIKPHPIFDNVKNDYQQYLDEEIRGAIKDYE